MRHKTAHWWEELSERYANCKQLDRRERLALGLITFYREISESDIMLRSAALSYTVAVSLVPLVTTSIAFLTAFPGLQTERNRLTTALSEQLLPSAVQSVQEYISRFADRAAAAGAVSSLVFFIVVLMLLQALELAFNGIWRVTKPRGWGERFKTLALYFIAGAIAVTLFMVVEQKTGQLVKYVTGLQFLGLGRQFARASVFVGNLLVAWMLFTISYKVLPNTKVRWRAAMIAGALAGTSWHFLKSGFTWYINEIASYRSIYGALGAIPIFFLWVYLSFLLLLGGGYVSLVVQDLRALVLERRSMLKGEARGYYAVAVAGALARAFRACEAPLTADEIAERLDIPVYFVSDAMTCLCVNGLVACLDPSHGKDSERYVLAKPGDAVTVDQVVRQVAGEAYLVPEGKRAGALHRYLEDAFGEAREQTRRSLHNLTISDVGEHLDKAA